MQCRVIGAVPSGIIRRASSVVRCSSYDSTVYQLNISAVAVTERPLHTAQLVVTKGNKYSCPTVQLTNVRRQVKSAYMRGRIDTSHIQPVLRTSLTSDV